MAKAQAERIFGATNEPEIASDELVDIEDRCALQAKFVHEDVRVRGGSLAEVDAGSGRLTHAVLEEVDVRGSRLCGLRLVDVRGVSLDASNSDWRGAHLRRVSFSGCRLTGVTLSEVNLEEVRFSDCKLDYANFRSAELSEVTFEDCVLTEADFQGARAESSRFSGCLMQGTDFTKAELDGVDLRGSELGLTGGVEALRGAIVSTVQAIDLTAPLAEAAGITILD